MERGHRTPDLGCTFHAPLKDLTKCLRIEHTYMDQIRQSDQCYGPTTRLTGLATIPCHTQWLHLTVRPFEQHVLVLMPTRKERTNQLEKRGEI